MLELPGQPALSDFRIAKLTRALQRVDERVTSVAANYTYFVATNGKLSREERSRLDALLLSGEKPAALPKGTSYLFVVPRPGTISPWSSKATDIAKACDIDAVIRIERGIRYSLKYKGKVDSSAAMNVAPFLFDRMTEAVFPSSAEVEALFEAHEPAPVVIIPLAKKGRAALVAANTDLGLALSDDEIDYLVASYAKLDRDPTDAS